MSEEYKLVTTKQFVSEATRWLEAIARKESASVLFFPKTDRHIRLGHLLNNHELIRNVLDDETNYIFRPLNFEPHDVEDIRDLFFQIEERLNLSHITSKTYRFDEWVDYLKKQKLTLVLIVSEAEKYLNLEGKGALSALSELVDQYRPLIQVLCFFEKDITHPSFIPFLPSVTDLYENVFRYPLYSHEDTEVFIDVLIYHWKLPPIALPVRKHIIAECGGHFWLVKEAVRKIADTGKWMHDEEGMEFRLRSIYNLLSASEQKALQEVITHGKNFSSDEQLSLDYLKNMRVVDEKNKLEIGAFADFIQDLGYQSLQLALYGNQILINQIPINKIFSKKEYRVMKLLLEKKAEVVSRDEIAIRIWPSHTSEHYSDWAIDQLMTRVRKRLEELSLSPKLLQVVRGKGYLLRI